MKTLSLYLFVSVFYSHLALGSTVLVKTQLSPQESRNLYMNLVRSYNAVIELPQNLESSTKISMVTGIIDGQFAWCARIESVDRLNYDCELITSLNR